MNLLNEERLERTARIIEEGMAQRHYFGGQIYVSLRGNVILSAAFGKRGPAPSDANLSVNDLMLRLSSTKPIGAVAIAQQFEQGKLAWDDPVSKFIPEFAQKGKAAITVRHLLTHTAGFRSADRVPEDLPWDETIAQICAAPLEPGWVPGQRAGYQIVSGWFILAEIVAGLSSQSYDEYLRSRIFLPLELTDSWVGMPPEAFRKYGERIAPMYSTDIGQPRLVPLWNTEKGCSICRPGSNGRGPAFELARFYEALLEPRDVRLLQGDTVKEMTRRHRVGMFDQTFRHILDWGLGFIINSNRYGPETVPYGYGRHASQETFGHSGAQSSSGFVDPKHGLVVVWIFNGMPGERPHQKRARELNSAIYEDLKLASF